MYTYITRKSIDTSILSWVLTALGLKQPNTQRGIYDDHLLEKRYKDNNKVMLKNKKGDIL